MWAGLRGLFAGGEPKVDLEAQSPSPSNTHISEQWLALVHS